MDFSSNYQMTINGRAVGSPATIAVVNPADEQVFAQAPDCTREQLDEAVAAARAAFPAWSATPIEERRAAIRGLGEAIVAQADAIGRLLTREQGKVASEAKVEVISLGMLLQAQSQLEIPVHVAEENKHRVVETRYLPLGVVGAIAPWNFPLLLAGFKIGPGLLAGNTMVLKPSPYTPLATLKIAELAREFFPPGVLNVVSGGDDLGPWLTSHPGIDKVSFTGSTQTGRRVMESAASSLKRITLELGGNDAAIVLADVDVAKVADKLFWSAFANNGQICIATKRLYIHEDVYEPLKQALLDYAADLTIGDGAEQGSRLGPINNRPQFERVRDLLADSEAQGHVVHHCGQVAGESGYFLPITFVDNPPEDSRIVREEQFGPVLPLLKYASIDEVIERANDSDYGLAGSIWSGDEDAALAVAERLQTGTVFINHQAYLSPFAVFGGQKQSGIGVEGGVEGLLEYMQPRTFVRRNLSVG